MGAPVVQSRQRLGGETVSGMQLELLDKLADDNMAEVHLGRLTTDEGLVLVTARKLLRQVAAVPEVVPALLRVAAEVAQLAHPNLLRHLGFLESAGDFYWISERTEGFDLDTVLNRLSSREVRISSLRSLQVGVDFLAGLEALHQAGVIHGGLAPQHVVVGFDGVARLDGFGFERAMFGVKDLKQKSRRGRTEFLAPEMMQGRPPTIQSDVFSAAAILYTILTGSPPLDKKERGGMSVRHASILPPSKVDRSLPFSCDAVFVKALSISTSQRHEDGGALHNAISRLRASMVKGSDDGRDGVRDFIETMFPNEALVPGRRGSLERQAQGGALLLQALDGGARPQPRVLAPASPDTGVTEETQRLAPPAIPTRAPQEAAVDSSATTAAGPMVEADWDSSSQPSITQRMPQAPAADLDGETAENVVEDTDEIRALDVHDTDLIQAVDDQAAPAPQAPKPQGAVPSRSRRVWPRSRVLWVAALLVGVILLLILLVILFSPSAKQKAPDRTDTGATPIGFLTVKADQPATIIIDGEVMQGNKPMVDKLVRAGEHRVSVKDVRGATLLEETVQVEVGEHKQILVGPASAVPPKDAGEANPPEDKKKEPKLPVHKKKPKGKPGRQPVPKKPGVNP